MLCRLRQHDEGAAQIGGDHLVERLQVALGDRRKRHDAGAVHDHVDPTESVQRLLEETLHIGGVSDVGLHRDGLPAGDLISSTTVSALAALPA